MTVSMRPSTFSVNFFDIDRAKRNYNPAIKQVVGYARLSFDEDGEGFCSILNQQSILEDFYRKKYEDLFSSYEFISDDNVSGYKFEREGLYRLLSLIEQGKCNVIIAKDLSRIGRHSALTQLFIEQCEKVGIRIHAMDDYDSSKESDDLILGIRAWSNERVVKDASAKIKKIVKHKQENGTWFCAAPFGYRVKSYENGTVEVDPEAAKTVNYIFKLFLDGKGINKLARILTEEGLKTPSMIEREQFIAAGREYKKRVSSEWRASQLATILDNEFYIGTLVTGRYKRDGINGKDVRTNENHQHRFENHHEPIVNIDVFNEVQTLRKQRAKEHYRNKGVEHLFHGMLFCGECGSVLFTYSKPGLTTQYVCSKHFRFGNKYCTRHTVKEPLLNSIAIEYLKTVRESCRDTIDALDEEVRNQSACENYDATIDGLEKTLTSMRNELRVVEEQRIKQIIAHPEREDVLNQLYDEMHENLQAKINTVEERLKTAEGLRSSSSMMAKKARKAIDVIDNVIETGELTRRSITAIFDKIMVHDDGNIVVHLKPYLQGFDLKTYEKKEKSRNQPEETFKISASRPSEDEKANIVCDGDPLEIYTDHDGEVVLKKYSPIGEIATIAKDYTDSLYRTLGHMTLIGDRDAVVAVSGASKHDQWEKALSAEVENLMQERTSQMKNLADGERMLPLVKDDAIEQYTAQIVVPIVADGEVVGCLMLASRNSGARMRDVDMKVAETTAVIIGRQMEQ